MCHKLQVFPGNKDRNSIITNSLEEFASAKFIRFQPTAYSGYKGLRVEVYGILLSKGIYLLSCLPPACSDDNEDAITTYPQ